MKTEPWLDSWYLSLAPSNEEVRIADTIPDEDFGALPEMFNNDPASFIDTLPDSVMSSDSKKILIDALIYIGRHGIKPSIIFNQLLDVHYQCESSELMRKYEDLKKLKKMYKRLKNAILTKGSFSFFPTTSCFDYDDRCDSEHAFMLLDKLFQKSEEKYARISAHFKPKRKGFRKIESTKFMEWSYDLIVKRCGFSQTKTFDIIAKLLSAITNKECHPETVKTHIAKSKKHTSKK